MGRRLRVAAAMATVQLGALWATFPTGIGTAGWHHAASLALVLAGALAVRRRMGERPFLGVGVLATSVLAAASGFVLLYWKEGIRADGYQDWGVFWHVLWSWAAAVFFWQHTWVNRVVFAHFMRRSLRRAAPAALHVGAYVLALAALAWTATAGKGRFTGEAYIPLSYWTWLAVAGAAYLVWLATRRVGTAGRLRMRAGVDLALVPAAAAASLSGVPLLWLDPELDAAGLKYASKYWHVGPSVLFSVLAFTHAAQTWAAFRNYGRPPPASQPLETPALGPAEP